MALAILQNDLIEPTPQQLVAAFAAIPELTDFDARRRAQEAVGIIAERLDEDQARTLLGALAGQNIAAAIVDESDLPVLPTAYRIHEAHPDGKELLVLDALNRPLTFAWSNVTLIAAGLVNTTDIKTKITAHVHRTAGGFTFPVQDHKTTETRNLQPVAEVFLSCEPHRLRMEAKGFRFGYLGGNAPRSRSERFDCLVLDLARHAPQAAINRGADAIVQNQPRRSYRSAQSFEREITWLLWLSRSLSSNSTH
ncbi:MAG: hypothetical protein IT445_15195 [Phycisphaeraceae bacterium]|nr:hypothetical protein [Phycisphaeraceae bacterium]